MNTNSIIIEAGQVAIRPTTKNVWLSQHQIAYLFGVFVSAVGGNVRPILKSEALQEHKICHRRANGKQGFMAQQFVLSGTVDLARVVKPDLANGLQS